MKAKKGNFNFVVAVMIAMFTSMGCTPQASQFPASDQRLSTQAGVRKGASIVAGGQAGYLVFGPYVSLEPGIYRLVAKGNLVGTGNILGVIDAVSDKGAQVLGAKTIVAGQAAPESIASLLFEVRRSVTDAEFRLSVTDQTKGSFTGYELVKVAKVDG